jgi:hypothetical protein
MAKNTSVMGIYSNRSTVSEALNILKKAGYRAADISILSSDEQGSKEFAHVKQNKALYAAAIGAAAGAAIGAALAFLMSNQLVNLPAFGPLVAAGPILATFAGAGAGGALGWIIGLLSGLRLTEYVAKRFAGRIQQGGILLSVHCDSQEWCDRAKKALRDTGARDISSAPETAADYGTTDRPTARATAVVLDPVETPAVATVPVEAPVVLAAETVPVEIKK